MFSFVIERLASISSCQQKTFIGLAKKDKECNWKIYPATVRCYEYDRKNRVTQMQLEGSGTTGYHTYGYDHQDRIIEMRSNFENYKMTYDSEGNLLRMAVEHDGLLKELSFIYETK